MSAPAQSANGKPAAADAAPKSSTAAADVGWQFVPQYYTMMHDAPERLHCFYNKKSTFVHGVEGEEVAPSLGQQAIHQKVLSLGLSNCKAFIHHIDTQPSFQGGILLQVIGEMSNASGPWRKFTQTFFLAEQPNGYYVLNDIFRYLKEDGEDEDEEEEEEQGEENAADVGLEVTATEPSSATEQSPAPVQAATEPVKVDADILTVAGAPGVLDLADGAAAVKQETAASEPPAAKDEPPAPVSQEHQPEAPKADEAKPEPVVEQSKPAPVPVKQEETSTAAPVKEHKEEKPGAPAAADPSAKSSRPTSTSPAPNAGRRQSPSRAKPSAGPAQPPAAPPAAAAPPKPRTWASTAAAKPAAWGTALATKEALSNPTTAASALPAAKLVQAEKAAPVQQQPQAKQQQQQQQQQQGQQGQGQKYPLVEAAKAVQTAICFVKLNNWQAQDSTEQITEAELRRVLSKSAGVGPSEITKVEIVRDKACAFVEFAKVDAARRAIIASLLTNQGGGGGIKTDGGHRIIVESRKEKSERKSGASPAAGGQAPQQGASAQQNARRQGSGQNQGQNQNQNQHQHQNQQNPNRAGGNAVRGGRAGRGGQGQGAK